LLWVWYLPGIALLSDEIECWSRWLLHTRFRGPHGKETLDFLSAIRDRVLDRAQLRPGDFVLDVGSGDGLLAFGALSRVAPDGLVVIDDVSPDVLDTCRRVAEQANALDRTQFVQNDAADLRDVPDASVDAVLTRSVLIYVPDKARAAAEFRRVLRPGGRISLFEPIHRVSLDGPRFGIDPGPVAGLADRVEQVFRSLQPPETDPMLNFDERTLLQVFDLAGFAHLDLEVHVSVRREYRDGAWFESMLDGIGNPRIPSLRQAIASALTEEEAATYLAHYRRAVAGAPVVTRQAHVYLYGGVE
jgi:SAM-dependent methyltransferase